MALRNAETSSLLDVSKRSRKGDTGDEAVGEGGTKDVQDHLGCCRQCIVHFILSEVTILGREAPQLDLHWETHSDYSVENELARV